MIKIGINKGIFIAGASYEPATDKVGAHMKITFEEAGATKYANAFERMNADESVEHLPTRDVILFGPSKPLDKDQRGNTRTEEQKANVVNADITSIKSILLHLLYGFYTTKEARLELYDGIDIDGNNYNAKIIQEPIMNAVFKNMTDQFIAKMKPYFGKSDAPFRLLLIRQDAAKNFPSFRRKNITENPFWEPMTVDEKESKVMFTPYEIENGLDSDLPIKKKQADNPSQQSNGGQAPLTADSVFG